MFNGILGPVLFGIVFVALVLAILFHKSIRNLKIFRSSAEKAAERAARRAAKEEEYFRRTSTKRYQPEDGMPKFSKDYFKSSDEQTAKEQPQTHKGQFKAQEQPRQQEETTAQRATTTSSGVTIIDERAGQQSERKIFNEGEGEYVEFEEV